MTKVLFDFDDRDRDGERIDVCCPFCMKEDAYINILSHTFRCMSCKEEMKVSCSYAELEEEDPFLEFKGKLATLDEQITELQNYMSIMRRECQQIKDRSNE